MYMLVTTFHMGNYQNMVDFKYTKWNEKIMS
jgi:hypothetical protein